MQTRELGRSGLDHRPGHVTEVVGASLRRLRARYPEAAQRMIDR